MRCRKAERLLHLYGEGELADRERRALDRHLEGCAVCSERAASMERLAGLTAGLRSDDPVLTDPERMTDEIMAVVAAEARQRTNGWSKKRAVGVFTRRFHLQPALAAALALIVLALGVQEVVLLKRLASLEERMAQLGSVATADRSVATQTGGPLDSELARLANRGVRATGLLPSRGDDGLIVLRRSELVSLLASAVGPGADPATVENLLTRRFPELGTITLADGITMDEARRLLAYRTEILHALRGI